jgi:signal transduction histidine kinase/CheY-like chemotaxis protein
MLWLTTCTAEFFTRRGAKRAARAVLQEAVSAWTRINATGKARHLSDKHEWLLKTAITSRTNDVGVQTSDSLSHARAVGTMDEQERQIEQRHGEKIKDERTREWLQPGKGVDSDKIGDLSSLGLDIIDLSSILEFSQVISSELQIDRSVSKMIEIILESAGGQADFAAIVINQKDGNGWSVVATGSTDDGVQSFPEGSLLTDVEDQVAQQVTLYTLRFKEPVFIDNILEDERFSNVSETYLERNPMGKAIIVLPIMTGDHLMGSLYLEGQPHAFTQRNLVVLRLLSQQVGISIANALLFKEVRKVSASNEAMIESQKRALAQARAAEQKAKVAEAEAMRNVKLKEEAAKAKSMFLANVSHELRTPLNGVIGMSELLKGTTLNQEQEGYADSIRVCADTLLTVINDILDFSKLEAGKMKMFSVPLNLRETITEVVRALEYTNLERGLETIEDLDIPQDLLVLGDPVRLHQILMNLLSNSYKFTPKGSVTVRAKPDYETKDKIKITCSVSDTGIGISQEQLTKLFKPFSQADSSTARSYGGSGLGLSICKAMIENVLGGKIWLESTPGKGTTVFFQLTFPKAPKNSTAAIPHVSAKDPDPMANWSHGSGSTAGTPPPCDLSQIPREEIRVCIAEDNPINQKIAVSFVTKLGLQCEAYNDGQQAVDALRLRSKEGTPFHLVLMDVQMPVLDGYNATRAIRSDEDHNVRGVVVIAMTASAIRGDREKCLEAGMNNYLAKPVRAAVLKSMLEEYLSQTPQGIQLSSENAMKEVMETPPNENGTVQNGEAKGANSPQSPRSPARSRKPKRQTTLTDKDMNKANTDAMTTIPEAEEKRADSVDSKKEVTVRTRDVSENKRTPNGTQNGSVDALVKPNAVEGEAT